MEKQIYEDYKYVMQDTYQLYLGAKYTFEEITDNEEIPFKFRLIVERYVYQDVDPQTTLESHFYYLSDKGILFKTYKHIKLKVKINVIEETRSLFGKRKQANVTKVLPIQELAAIPVEEKQRMGVVIQEIMCSKLALMAF